MDVDLTDILAVDEAGEPQQFLVVRRLDEMIALLRENQELLRHLLEGKGEDAVPPTAPFSR
jgi:hypothetical protein